jgi:hypothetical protein
MAASRNPNSPGFDLKAEYTQPNLNERLISCGNLVAGLEDVTFAATRVQELHRMLVINLFAQPVYVNLDRI